MFDQCSDDNILVSPVVKPPDKGMKNLLKEFEEEFGSTSPGASVSAHKHGDQSRNLLEELKAVVDQYSINADGSVSPAVKPPDKGMKNLLKEFEEEFGSTSPGASVSGDSNKVSGPSSSAVVATDSGDLGNLDDKQVPGLNGHMGDGENNSESFGHESLDAGSQSDSGSQNLPSGSGSSLRSTNSDGVDHSDQNQADDLGVSGSVNCSTDKTVSG
ncbi:submandibular gland protein C-like isoform X1 [Arvicanthis niloticus]|uniref:submandibular gland protein C-like isoform X1 n=1 Tax=Arvicanthis niloticus TaxID=61156 RepID=UPI00402BF171